MPVPVVVTVRFLVPRVIVCPAEVKLPLLMNCKSYTPAGPAPDTLTAPPTVMAAVCDESPIARVPAVIAARSAACTLNVPVAEATEMVLAAVFGVSVTVPLPALTLPENATSLAVMVIGALVDEMEVDTALVTLPVPLVVMVTPVVPVALAFRATRPLVEVAVLILSRFADKALLIVVLPAADMSSVPDAVTVPLVPSVPAAVVVTV